MLLKGVEKTDRDLLNVFGMYVQRCVTTMPHFSHDRWCVGQDPNRVLPGRQWCLRSSTGKIHHKQPIPDTVGQFVHPYLWRYSESDSKSKYCITAYLFTDFHGR